VGFDGLHDLSPFNVAFRKSPFSSRWCTFRRPNCRSGVPEIVSGQSGGRFSALPMAVV